MRFQLDRLAAWASDTFGDLPRRARLTIRYHGWRTLLFRVATFPLRFTPLRDRLGLPQRAPSHWATIKDWYRRHGRPVAVVIPAYGDATVTRDAVESIQATTPADRVTIIVSDDGSSPAHVADLRAIEGIRLVTSERNTGFSAACNRGIRAAGSLDVVLLNSDVIAHPGWLEAIQYAAYGADDVGIVGPKLLYPDGTIQSAGSHRNIGAPEWFDHRYRFRESDYPPANVQTEVLATTGAAMYLKRSLLDEIGLFDEAYGMAYEDVDLCLRTWEAGHRVLYTPHASLTHLESKTRGMTQGERELGSQRYFWERWGGWFDERNVRSAAGDLRVVYVTQDTGVGGGHRVVFEHLHALHDRGHEAELWTLEHNGGPPDWFDLRVPVRTFPDYEALVAALSDVEGIKVATWWNTAVPVWKASVRAGVPAYFVQDIETSYYPDQPQMQGAVLDSYRHEFRYVTTSAWVRDRLRELHVDPAQVQPGVDLDTFRPLDGVARERDVLLTAGRTNPLKNFELTARAYASLDAASRPRLWLYGIEPHVGADLGARYFERPSDAEVNELYNRATAYVQTSRHEGFCLPVLEAMAAGCPVITTDSHGNRDFCHDEVNCLLVDDTPQAVAAAVERLFAEPALRDRLARAGLETARAYDWDAKRAELVDVMERIGAAAQPQAPATASGAEEAGAGGR